MDYSSAPTGHRMQCHSHKWIAALDRNAILRQKTGQGWQAQSDLMVPSFTDITQTSHRGSASAQNRCLQHHNMNTSNKCARDCAANGLPVRPTIASTQCCHAAADSSDRMNHWHQPHCAPFYAMSTESGFLAPNTTHSTHLQMSATGYTHHSYTA